MPSLLDSDLAAKSRDILLSAKSAIRSGTDPEVLLEAFAGVVLRNQPNLEDAAASIASLIVEAAKLMAAME